MASLRFPVLPLSSPPPPPLPAGRRAALFPVPLLKHLRPAPDAASRRIGLPVKVGTRRHLCRGLQRNATGHAEEVKTREPMVPPYNVLVTGSTKGIGYALAKEFLKAGDNVVICSRSAERVESAVQNLRAEFGEQHVALFVMLEKQRMSRLWLPLHVISSNMLISGSTMLDQMHTATNHWLRLLMKT